MTVARSRRRRRPRLMLPAHLVGDLLAGRLVRRRCRGCGEMVPVLHSARRLDRCPACGAPFVVAVGAV